MNTHTATNASRSAPALAYPASHLAADRLEAIGHHLLQRLVSGFFPGTTMVRLSWSDAHANADVTAVGKYVLLTHEHRRYGLERGRPFSVLETQLLASIGRSLSRRLGAVDRLQTSESPSTLLEDHSVAAFLTEDSLLADTLVQAIGVVRRCAASTYENRRITTGALVQTSAEPRDGWRLPRGTDAVSYASSLAEFKTFRRLCDGTRTIALVDRAGLLVGIADIGDCESATGTLPCPVASVYEPHARATLDRGAIAVVLGEDGVIRIFAAGVQVIAWAGGRWVLCGSDENTAACEQHVGNVDLARRLLSVSLNIGVRRRGGIFVVLDDRASEDSVLTVTDRLGNPEPVDDTTTSRRRFHYLWRQANALTMAPTMLESVAELDGAVVMRRSGQLVAIGAILRGRHQPADAEGARTTAALAASHVGAVLKVSEDGFVALYSGGRRIWETV